MNKPLISKDKIQKRKRNIAHARKNFPILQTEVNGSPLVYLDNAATTQKPNEVIDSIERFYSDHNANIHRGVHYLSEKATDLYESARETIRAFINAESLNTFFICGDCNKVFGYMGFFFGMVQEPSSS